MFLIDIQNKKAVSLEKKSFSELKLSERYDLQEWIANNPRILGENLLIIQKEFEGFLKRMNDLICWPLMRVASLSLSKTSSMIPVGMWFGKP